ncbi:MAG: tRNA (adenosine(37)-N6)-threonylcarbamoyltransferase complex ATPase subunit type 1 TsaE [Clostridiales bacterium]|jgi:tRNA threonylcarbamoyladenosine biosynthesis protein TsaE|nr:tRNA (adenosine(37)-N6)-threonylcarbamoyltransferase complex ATPase subunit type 1 TsaE [Clostridiales bacterium]
MNYTSYGPEQTKGLAARIGSFVAPGTVFALWGDLGAGKTTFAQGLARGLDVIEQVVSPTFILLNQYQGRLPFYHLDAYRLAGDEAFELGFDELFYEEAVILVEWPQNLGALLPNERIDVMMENFTNFEEDTRHLTFKGINCSIHWLEKIFC